MIFDEDAYRDKQLNKYLDAQDAASDLEEQANTYLDKYFTDAIGNLLGDMIADLEYHYNYDFSDAREIVFQFIKDSM